MPSTIGIYLSGSIKKSHDKSVEIFWEEADMQEIKSIFHPMKVVFMDPASRSDNLSDFLSTFGRDVLQVYCSDLLFVDAREKRGIGVGSEMTIAKIFNIPVVCIVPPSSHYYRQNIELQGQFLSTWIHPFIFGLSDVILPTVQEAAIWARDNYNKWKRETIACPERLLNAMVHYINTQIRTDKEMRDIVDTDEHIRTRIEQLIGSNSLTEYLKRQR